MSLKFNVQVLLDKLKSKKKKREIILLMGSIYLLAMNRIPHPNTYEELIELQVLNVDK